MKTGRRYHLNPPLPCLSRGRISRRKRIAVEVMGHGRIVLNTVGLRASLGLGSVLALRQPYAPISGRHASQVPTHFVTYLHTTWGVSMVMPLAYAGQGTLALVPSLAYVTAYARHGRNAKNIVFVKGSCHISLRLQCALAEHPIAMRLPCDE